MDSVIRLAGELVFDMRGLKKLIAACVCCAAGYLTASETNTYLVIDLSAGPQGTNYTVRFSATPPDLSQDVCRTHELWLRRIEPGTFPMGSPLSEIGRGSYETRHTVTLSQPFYIGIFELTQQQYTLITGANTAFYKGATRPLESISYTMLRGEDSGALAGQAGKSSFLGILQKRTPALLIDLPTEAQWEYACRAGTTNALNSNANLHATDEDTALNALARYHFNTQDNKGGYAQHTRVGSYAPNAWGLYDTHGNVGEWCFDQWGGDLGASAQKDPRRGGGGTGIRVIRGGSWGPNGLGHAFTCRAAFRCSQYGYGAAYGNCREPYWGVRIIAIPDIK